MATYTLGAVVGVSAYTVVEADSLEEAIKEAKDREPVIGGNGSGTDENEQWIIDDADGTPSDIHEI